MNVLISTLPGSDVHRLCVEVYLRHHDAGTGACAQCGCPARCPTRLHAASVIVAAGEDPRWYDAQASADPRRNAGPFGAGDGRRSDHAARDGVPANVEGYRVGGRVRRADVPYQEDER